MVTHIHHYTDSTRRGMTLCGQPHVPLTPGEEPRADETAECPRCVTVWQQRRYPEGRKK